MSLLVVLLFLYHVIYAQLLQSNVKFTEIVLNATLSDPAQQQLIFFEVGLIPFNANPITTHLLNPIRVSDERLNTGSLVQNILENGLYTYQFKWSFTEPILVQEMVWNSNCGDEIRSEWCDRSTLFATYIDPIGDIVSKSWSFPFTADKRITKFYGYRSQCDTHELILDPASTDVLGNCGYTCEYCLDKLTLNEVSDKDQTFSGTFESFTNDPSCSCPSDVQFIKTDGLHGVEYTLYNNNDKIGRLYEDQTRNRLRLEIDNNKWPLDVTSQQCLRAYYVENDNLLRIPGIQWVQYTFEWINDDVDLTLLTNATLTEAFEKELIGMFEVFYQEFGATVYSFYKWIDTFSTTGNDPGNIEITHVTPNIYRIRFNMTLQSSTILMNTIAKTERNDTILTYNISDLFNTYYNSNTSYNFTVSHTKFDYELDCTYEINTEPSNTEEPVTNSNSILILSIIVCVIIIIILTVLLLYWCRVNNKFCFEENFVLTKNKSHKSVDTADRQTSDNIGDYIDDTLEGESSQREVNSSTVPRTHLTNPQKHISAESASVRASGINKNLRPSDINKSTQILPGILQSPSGRGTQRSSHYGQDQYPAFDPDQFQDDDEANDDYGNVTDIGEQMAKHTRLPKSKLDNEMDKLLKSNEAIEFKFDDLSLIKCVGRGSYGKVYKARYKGNIVAVKIFTNLGNVHNSSNNPVNGGSTFSLRPGYNNSNALDIDLNALDDEAYKELYAEIVLTAKIPYHPCINKIMGFCRKPLSVIMEYLGGGSVKSIIYNENKLRAEPDNEEKLIILTKAAHGLFALNHEHKMQHRDIAARNILISDYDERITRQTIVKITDFGMSRKNDSDKDQKTKAEVGPLKWMAPESIQKQVYSEKSDVYMFAITMWEIMYGQEPYKNEDALNTAMKVVMKQERPEFLWPLPDGLELLIQKCWDQNPKIRPTFQIIVKTLKTILDNFQSEIKQNDIANNDDDDDNYDNIDDNNFVPVNDDDDNDDDNDNYNGLSDKYLNMNDLQISAKQGSNVTISSAKRIKSSSIRTAIMNNNGSNVNMGRYNVSHSQNNNAGASVNMDLLNVSTDQSGKSNNNNNSNNSNNNDSDMNISNMSIPGSNDINNDDYDDDEYGGYDYVPDQ